MDLENKKQNMKRTLRIRIGIRRETIMKVKKAHTREMGKVMDVEMGEMVQVTEKEMQNRNDDERRCL